MTEKHQAAIDEDLVRRLHERALRHSLWLSTFHARQLGLTEVQGQLTSILVNVKALQSFEGPA